MQYTLYPNTQTPGNLQRPTEDIGNQLGLGRPTSLQGDWHAGHVLNPVNPADVVGDGQFFTL